MRNEFTVRFEDAFGIVVKEGDSYLGEVLYGRDELYKEINI